MKSSSGWSSITIVILKNVLILKPELYSTILIITNDSTLEVHDMQHIDVIRYTIAIDGVHTHEGLI